MEGSNTLKKRNKGWFGLGKKEKDVEVSATLTGVGVKNWGIKRDAATGQLDLEGLPEEFKQKIQHLLEGQQDKTIKHEEPAPGTPVLSRKGPRVDKGLKSDQILELMKDLCHSQSPWEHYNKDAVRYGLKIGFL